MARNDPKVEKLNGKLELSLGRGLNAEEPSWLIRATDVRSGTQVMEGRFTAEQFADLLSSRIITFDAELIRSALHGRTRESRREMFPCPKMYPDNFDALTKHEGAWTSAGRAEGFEAMKDKALRVHAAHGTTVRARQGSEEYRVTRSSRYHVREVS